MMAIQGPAQLLLPPQYRGLGPAGTINEVATEINAIHELHQPSPEQKAQRDYGKAIEARIKVKGPGPRQGRRFR